MVVYLEILALLGWILAFLPVGRNWDVEIQPCRLQTGESREMYNIQIPAQFSEDFKYTWGVDQKHLLTSMLICDLRFLAQSNCHTSVLGSCSISPCLHASTGEVTCCDLSVSLVLVNLFSLKSETFHEITNHVIMTLLSVTFYLRGDLTLRGLQDNQEKISSPQISFVLWMLKLLDCGIWKAKHSQHLDILFCVSTLNFYMLSNIAEWSGCKAKVV